MSSRQKNKLIRSLKKKQRSLLKELNFKNSKLETLTETSLNLRSQVAALKSTNETWFKWVIVGGASLTVGSFLALVFVCVCCYKKKGQNAVIVVHGHKAENEESRIKSDSIFVDFDESHLKFVEDLPIKPRPREGYLEP